MVIKFTKSRKLPTFLHFTAPGNLVNLKYSGTNFRLEPVIAIVLANTPPEAKGTWSADRLYTVDRVSTVIDLEPHEHECDHVRAQPSTRQRSRELEAAMFAFYRDVALVPPDTLKQMPCYEAALNANVETESTATPASAHGSPAKRRRRSSRGAQASDAGSAKEPLPTYLPCQHVSMADLGDMSQYGMPD